MEVNEAFRSRFPEKDPPANRKTWKTVKIAKKKEQV